MMVHGTAGLYRDSACPSNISHSVREILLSNGLEYSSIELKDSIVDGLTILLFPFSMLSFPSTIFY